MILSRAAKPVDVLCNHLSSGNLCPYVEFSLCNLNPDNDGSCLWPNSKVIDFLISCNLAAVETSIVIST